MADYEQVFHKVGLDVTLSDWSLFDVALTTPKYALENGLKQCHNTLNTIGSLYITAVTALYLCEMYPTLSVAELEHLKQAIVREQSVARLSKSLGLVNLAKLPSALQNNVESVSDKVHKKLFGAFLGALISVKGAHVAKHFLIECIDRFLPADASEYVNHKEDYQIFCQRRRLPTPVYINVHVDGKLFTQATFLSNVYLESLPKSVQDRIKEFNVKTLSELDDKLRLSLEQYTTTSDSKLVGMSSAHKKRIAEQECARQALDMISLNENCI